MNAHQALTLISSHYPLPSTCSQDLSTSNIPSPQMATCLPFHVLPFSHISSCSAFATINQLWVYRLGLHQNTVTGMLYSLKAADHPRIWLYWYLR
jgi:hypothetical protein